MLKALPPEQSKGITRGPKLVLLLGKKQPTPTSAQQANGPPLGAVDSPSIELGYGESQENSAAVLVEAPVWKGCPGLSPPALPGKGWLVFTGCERPTTSLRQDGVSDFVSPHPRLSFRRGKAEQSSGGV